MPDPNDPEFSNHGRPRCPSCRTRMITAELLHKPEGFERRTLECLKCGHSEQKVTTVGPTKSHTLAWINREFEHSGRKG